MVGYYGFMLDVRVSVGLSVRFSFPDDNLCKHQWIFTKLGMCIDYVDIWFGIANGLYALTLRRSVLELLMGKFHQMFTELSARDMPIFSFLDDNLSK